MDITTLAKGVIEAIRIGGPIGAAIGGVAVIAGLLTSSGRARVRLSAVGLTGSARGRVWTRTIIAALVPGLAVSVLAVSLALEQEVRDGPNRVINQLAQPAQAAGGVAWVFEQGTSHLMDDSRIDDTKGLAAAPPTGVYPFWSQLAIVQYGNVSQAGLVFAPAIANGSSPLSPRVVKNSARCSIVNGRCAIQPGQAVVDADLAPIGSHVTIRGQHLTIVAHTAQPISLLNRSVVFVAPELFRQPNGIMAQPYGFIVAGPDAIARAHRIASNLPNVQVLSQSELLAANSRFWAGNGTPLILLVIAMTAIFAGAAMYGARRAAQEQARAAIGTLRALGLTPLRACLVDLTRAIAVTFAAAVVALPVAIVLVDAANLAILGFHATVNVLMVLSAAGVVIASDALGTVVLWSRLRTASIVESINGT